MKKYEVPQARIVSFDNDYVAASSRSRLQVAAFFTCSPSEATYQNSDYLCGSWNPGRNDG